MNLLMTNSVISQDIIKYWVNDSIRCFSRRSLSELIKNKGNTDVKIKYNNGKEELIFKLKNKRFVDRKLVNIIKNQDILATIS